MTKLPFIFVLFAVFCNGEIIDDNELQNIESRDVFVRNTFGTLLKSIVKINEQRFDAMKKLAKLQDYNVAMDFLRNGNQDDSSGSALTLFIIDGGSNKNPEVKQSGRMDAADSSESGRSSDENKYKNDNTLRVWKSCQKKAAKVCRKACVDAYKTACSEYVCSKKMKKALKKECKSACKNRFH